MTAAHTCKAALISIHALLAESDTWVFPTPTRTKKFLSTLSLRRATFFQTLLTFTHNYFYPRSPCGERPGSNRFRCCTRYFYPRSPCGERPVARQWDDQNGYISIHALLAESDIISIALSIQPTKFLSTLSLRRATFACAGRFKIVYNFYPRSPCGERQARSKRINRNIAFLSTLSLRRATLVPHQQKCRNGFLSTLSLRRATLYDLRALL